MYVRAATNACAESCPEHRWRKVEVPNKVYYLLSKTAMNRTLLFWLLLLTPFSIMVIVNETSNPPIDNFDQGQCTRYCHNIICKHTKEKYEANNNVIINKLESIYFSNISWLRNNNLGLSYKEINLLIYVFGIPLMMILLLWGAIRKKKLWLI